MHSAHIGTPGGALSCLHGVPRRVVACRIELTPASDQVFAPHAAPIAGSARAHRNQGHLTRHTKPGPMVFSRPRRSGWPSTNFKSRQNHAQSNRLSVNGYSQLMATLSQWLEHYSGLIGVGGCLCSHDAGGNVFIMYAARCLLACERIRTRAHILQSKRVCKVSPYSCSVESCRRLDRASVGSKMSSLNGQLHRGEPRSLSAPTIRSCGAVCRCSIPATQT